MRITIDLNEVIKVLIVLFWLITLGTERTSADLKDTYRLSSNSWQATTLDFANKNTANNFSRTILFSVSHFQPFGFDVQSIRIKKEGKQNFNYQIESQFSAGSQALYNNLNIKVIKNWQIIDQTSLTDFSFNSTIDQEHENLVLVLSLETDNESLINQSLSFNLLVKTTTNLNNEQMAFYDQEILENQVSTGNWF